MARKDFTIVCMTVTPFREDGTIDEEAFRAHLKRLVDARVAVYLGSPGSGEGAVLSVAETRRVYDIGVEVCKGKVPLYANPREPRSAVELLELANEAVAAGVDIVQLYQMVNGHGMIPNQREQEIYWKTVLDAITHPVCISIHSMCGYMASVPFLKKLCDSYPQIHAINVLGFPDSYFMQVRDAVPASVKMYGNASVAALGSDGTVNPHANVIPRISQSIADGWMSGDMQKVVDNSRTLQRFANVLSGTGGHGASALKMALKVLGLGNGVMRPPYALPPEEDQKRMSAAFDAMRIRELEGLGQPAR